MEVFQHDGHLCGIFPEYVNKKHTALYLPPTVQLKIINGLDREERTCEVTLFQVRPQLHAVNDNEQRCSKSCPHFHGAKCCQRECCIDLS